MVSALRIAPVTSSRIKEPLKLVPSSKLTSVIVALPPELEDTVPPTSNPVTAEFSLKITSNFGAPKY